MSSEIREKILALPAKFVTEKAGSAKALIQLDLTGDDAGQYAIDIADGACDVREETAEQPDVTVTMDGGDFVALTEGNLNAVQAFMGGKIKVAGNVGMVMQMMNWFKLG
jgi:putative sterol carrier protein